MDNINLKQRKTINKILKKGLIEIFFPFLNLLRMKKRYWI